MRLDALSLLALGVAAVGCAATGPLTLQMSYEVSGAPLVGTPRAVPCRLRITTVTDGRPRVSVGDGGDRFGSVLRVEHLQDWVTAGLGTLVTQQREDPALAASDILTAVAIRRLYAHSVATDLEGVVALEVRYLRRDGSALQRNYRGTAQKLNWFAAAGEYQDVLNQGLENVVHQIARDLPAVCADHVAARCARRRTRWRPRWRSPGSAAAGANR